MDAGCHLITRNTGLECDGGLMPMGGQVERFGADECLVNHLGFKHTRDPVVANVTINRRDQIPDAAFGHQPERIDQALDIAVIAALILESNFALPPDRLLQRWKKLDRLFATIPAGDVDVDPLVRRFRVSARRLWNRGEELDERGFGGFAQSEVVEQVRRAGQKERLNLCLVHAGQIGSILAQQ
jgi:hypothetical protein